MHSVGRRDHGVANASDLGGKRVGVFRRTISEFYLIRFVTLHGQNPEGMTLVDLSRSDVAEALCNGSVDAVVTAEPYLSAIRGRLGDGASVLPVQSSQYTYAVVVGRDAWIAGHPAGTVRFLQVVGESDDWIQGATRQMQSGSCWTAWAWTARSWTRSGPGTSSRSRSISRSSSPWRTREGG
jgi:ABC-type nitrate/sulfonate/bicarbonate transport system substrate-binding protein